MKMRPKTYFFNVGGIPKKIIANTPEDALDKFRFLYPDDKRTYERTKFKNIFKVKQEEENDETGT